MSATILKLGLKIYLFQKLSWLNMPLIELFLPLLSILVLDVSEVLVASRRMERWEEKVQSPTSTGQKVRGEQSGSAAPSVIPVAL